MSGLVPSIHFDSDLLPEADRFAYWSAAVAAYDVFLPREAPPFRAKVDAWMLGDIVITDSRLPALRFLRTAAKAAADGVTNYSFLLRSQGTWTGTLGDRPMTVGPGQVAIFDLSRPVDAHGSAGDGITVAVERSALDSALPEPVNLHGVILEGAMGRLFADHLLSLVRQLPNMPLNDAPTAASSTIGLAAAAIMDLPAAERLPGPIVVAARHKVRRHIDQNLESSELSPDNICKALGLSRSSLYRAFSSSGVAAYIRTRRLEAVHVLLNNPAERRSLAEIAYMFGFVSDAHFSRAFKQRFGYSPREARTGAGGVPTLPPELGAKAGPIRFRKWLEKIA